MYTYGWLTSLLRNPTVITWYTLSSPAIILISERESPNNTTLCLSYENEMNKSTLDYEHMHSS